MNKTWQLRGLVVYLTLGVPLAASCAREANTLDGDDTSSGAATATGGKLSTGGGSANKAGTSNAFGGTSAKAGSSAGGGTTTAGTAAEGGDSGTTGGSGGSAGTGSSGGKSTGGTGGTGATMVPPDVLARASAIVYYETQHPAAMDGTIQMKLFIKNQSADPLPMANVKIRYWFTAEVTTELHQYYTGPQAQTPKAAFVSDGANSNALMTFGGGSIVMGGDINASEVQLEISNNSGKFNQADDFSWQPGDATSTPNDKITLYLDDKLVWGCEPSGKCFDDAGAGGAGGQGAGGAP